MKYMGKERLKCVYERSWEENTPQTPLLQAPEDRLTRDCLLQPDRGCCSDTFGHELQSANAPFRNAPTLRGSGKKEGLTGFHGRGCRGGGEERVISSGVNGRIKAATHQVMKWGYSEEGGGGLESLGTVAFADV